MKTVLASVGTLLCLVVTVRGADVAELVKQLKSSDADTRRTAASTLAEFGQDAKPAVPALIVALKDRDLFVRRFAIKALGAIGPDASEAIPALQARLDDPRMEVQTAALDALGKMGSGGIDALIEILKKGDADPTMRSRVVTGLGNIGPSARAAVPYLLEIAQAPIPGGKKKQKAPGGNLRIEAITALGEVASSSDTSAVTALSDMMDKNKEKNGNVRRVAKNALQKIKRRK